MGTQSQLQKVNRMNQTKLTTVKIRTSHGNVVNVMGLFPMMNEVYGAVSANVPSTALAPVCLITLLVGSFYLRPRISASSVITA